MQSEKCRKRIRRGEWVMRHMNKKMEMILLALLMAVICAIGCIGFLSAFRSNGLNGMSTVEVMSILFGLSGIFFGAIMLMHLD